MSDYELQNFCMAFIDLLGQRDAMKGEGLLPQFKNATEEEKFKSRIKESIGQIVRLQENAAHFFADYQDVSMRNQLTGENLAIYDEVKRSKMKQQRWSDGLVLYTEMRGKAPMNAIMEIFATAGGLCLLGLGQRDPVRGGIDIAWGAELHDGEVYGPVVANSYEYETIAQYPRIVIGDRVVQYLRDAIQGCDVNDKAQVINKKFAEFCMGMICPDTDGYFILNYLGEGFTEAYTKDNHRALYKDAYDFAYEQYQEYRNSRNSKLATRYNWLLAYFEAHKELHV